MTVAPERQFFTRPEDDLLLRMRKQGYSWSLIAAEMPGRSVDTLKARYRRLTSSYRPARFREDPDVSPAAAALGSRLLLQRLIETGCVYGVQMAAYNARHGVA